MNREGEYFKVIVGSKRELSTEDKSNRLKQIANDKGYTYFECSIFDEQYYLSLSEILMKTDAPLNFGLKKDIIPVFKKSQSKCYIL